MVIRRVQLVTGLDYFWIDKLALKLLKFFTGRSDTQSTWRFSLASMQMEVLMDAKLRNVGDISIISIQGSLEIERTQPFREACIKHFSKKKLIFNMQEASFVGSTGIQAFLDMVRTIGKENPNGVKFVGVQSEFRRIFQTVGLDGLELYDSENNAITSFIVPPEQA
jgi:anti-anti-sigma factor